MTRYHIYLQSIPERPEWEAVRMSNGQTIVANIGRLHERTGGLGVDVFPDFAAAAANYCACRWVALDDTGDGETDARFSDR